MEQFYMLRKVDKVLEEFPFDGCSFLMTQLDIDSLSKWYRKQLKKKSKDFRKNAEKSYKSVGRTLKDIEELSKDLLKEATEEDSEGTATRFGLKLRELVDGFEVDQDITYESTEDMQAEIQQFINDLWGAGARWIKRMDKKHKSTIKVLDNLMKDLSRDMKILGKLLYEYSWVKDLERIDARINTLRDMTYSRDVFEEQIRQVRLKIDHARGEYMAAKKKYSDFVEKSNVGDLLNLDDEADRIATLLRMKLNTLKKPVKKFLQHDHGVRVSPAGSKALLDYFEDPYQAIIEEPDGQPGLIEGLEALKQAVETDAFPLKDRLGRRAIEEAESIKKGELFELQEQAKEIERKRKEFADSDVYSKDAKLKVEVEEARKNLEYHQNDLLRVKDDIERELEKMKDYKSRIEKELLKSFSAKVSIEYGETLEPLLQKCSIEPVSGEAV
ncbi:MAG: hypothetical protein BAJATHORv1_10195 [Candidatus Thorarchaeota archaeon]|nr:MAG: hypothetical protein BAJATHORv1_10195 [Candidatus Thorarchaeota archaeon]